MQGRQVLTGGIAGLAIAALTAGVALAGPAGAQTAASSPGAARTSWHVRTVAPLSSRAANIVVSPARHAAFELIAAHRGGEGPFRLRRISLTGGAAKSGRQFPVSQLSVAGGAVWVTGSVIRGQSGRAVLYQVSPATLTVVRSWRLTGWKKPVPGTSPVTGGARGTVWAAYGQHLRRISPRTGATLNRIRLSSRLFLSDTAADPSGQHLYVSAGTRQGGAVVREYAGGSGQVLARQAGGNLKYSAGGAFLTAVPGGVWPSFRTGMKGETILLRQAGLVEVALPSGGDQLYSWDQWASTVYGGGSLWLSQAFTGKTACIAPATGRVRSSAKLRQLNNGGTVLGVSSAARVVYAAGRAGLVAVSAPRTCWR
ncbi:MAG TPA: hypothetical protein VGG35_10135 [Streptosporangiaceae bacterium]